MKTNNAKVNKWDTRVRCRMVVNGDSMTLQAHKDSSDVNHIVARYQRTGELPPNPRGAEPQYGDVTHLQGDLTENYNYANQLAEDATAQLEADRQAAREAAQKGNEQPPASGGASANDKPTESSPAPPDDGG